MEATLSDTVEEKKKGAVAKHLRTYRNLLIISIVALVLSTAGSVFFFLKWDESANRYLVALSEQSKTRAHLNLIKEENDKLNQQINILRNPEMNIIALRAIDSTKNYKATIYYNTYTSEAYFDSQNLPLPSVDQQYQLWALVDSQFVNVSLISLDDIGIQKVRPMSRVSEWAVTLEPKGGSATPSIGQVIVLARI